ncbi:MAG: hypothetical protein M3220_07930 [Chloroflexota bacterium]|nr:hypothetical protein [Chloroflexota bacterium]
MGFVHAANAIGMLTPAQFLKAREMVWPNDAFGFVEMVQGDLPWRGG